MGVEPNTSKEISPDHVASLERKNRRRGWTIAGIATFAVVSGAIATQWDKINNFYDSRQEAKQEQNLTDAQFAELLDEKFYEYVSPLEGDIDSLRSDISDLESDLSDLDARLETYSLEIATTPVATQEETQITTNYSPELNVRIPGKNLRNHPGKYASIIEMLNNKTGFDWLQRDCGYECQTIDDIALIELRDSDIGNRIAISLYAEEGCSRDCELLVDEYVYELSEADIDSLINYNQEILFTDHYLLGAILEEQGRGYEGLVGLFSTADTMLDYDRLSELVKTSESVVFTPNSYCGDNMDLPMINLIPSMEGEDVNAFRVSKEVYGSILEYLGVNQGGGN